VSREDRLEAHPSADLVAAAPLAEKDVFSLFNVGRARVTLDAAVGQVTLHDVEFDRLDTVVVWQEPMPYREFDLRAPEVGEYHVVLVGKMLQDADGTAFTLVVREAADVRVPRDLLDRLEARLRRSLANTRPGGTPDREDSELADAIAALKEKTQ
jgi:hypothetical protein